MSSTIAYLRNRNYTGLDDIDKIKDDFYKVHVTVSYDSQIVDGKRRVIFTATKGMRSQKFDKITYECNGLVLEAPTWNPLVIPCPTPKTSVNNEVVNRLLNQNHYHIYKIMDGTVIYMYNWKGTWYISTTRGLDMAAVALNNKTYLELLNDVLAKYAIDFDGFVNTLDINSSYSFVIRHNSIHPFTLETDNCLIFIHKIVILKGYINYVRSTHELPFGIQYQEEVKNEVKLRELYSNLSTALCNWLSTKKDPLFGYMLISSAPYKVGGDHSCILFESSLMSQIRKFVYDRKFMNFGKDRSLATIVQGYLSHQRETFIELFPKYLPEYEKLEQIQHKLKDDITEYILKNDEAIINGTKKDNHDQKNDELNDTSNNHVQYLAELIQNKLKSTIHPVNSEKSSSHIKGIINDTKFTKLYVNLLKEN